MLSGYKVLSKRFIKSFPVSSAGFEIETELMVHAMELGLAVEEIDAPYDERPAGSTSKLSTYRDGLLIGWTIVRLFQSEKPFLFFSLLAATATLISAILGGGVILDFLETGRVERFPTAILAGLLGVIAILFFRWDLFSIWCSVQEVKSRS